MGEFIVFRACDTIQTIRACAVVLALATSSYPTIYTIYMSKCLFYKKFRQTARPLWMLLATRSNLSPTGPHCIGIMESYDGYS
jgi:hypothetical protein